MRNRLLFLTTAAVLLVSSPAVAQGCSRTWKGAEAEIQDYATLFVDPDEADNRGSVIQVVPETAPMYLVESPSVCNAVLHRAIRYLRVHNRQWREHREGDYEMALYRFGPYYSLSITMYENGRPVLTDPNVVPEDTGTSAPRMVFRVSDLRLVKVSDY